MLATIQSRITREDLKSGQYVPEKVQVLQLSPLDVESKKEYYKPAVVFLSSMVNGR